ncbi:MAG: PorT family protein, partial [Tannerella sp.]|nr:PorT family protein [Tannerella sp.]
MKKGKEKGKFEEEVRSKLYDFESDTNTDDWERIVAKLPAGKTAKLFPLKKYLSVAAAIAVLSVLVGGLYYFNNEAGRHEGEEARRHEGTKARMEEDAKAGREEWAKVQMPEIHDDLSRSIGKSEGSNRIRLQKQEMDAPPLSELKREILSTLHTPHEKMPDVEFLQAEVKKWKVEKLIAATQPVEVVPEKSRRRWGFGVGGGRLGVSSTSNNFSGDMFAPSADYAVSNGLNTEFTNNNNLAYTALNKLRSNAVAYPTSIEHKMPVSFGLGVSYYLNDRWTLQSGLVYSMLRSNWTVDNVFNETNDYKQRLHYVGLPLSASYKLGQWKRLKFYASAGGMVEYNVAGRLKKVTIYDNEKLTENTSLKMKEPYFSVNSRLGVTCPIWRFIG